MTFLRTRPRRFQPRLLVGRGTRATEAFLLDELDRLLAEAEADPTLLGRPVRVVVPSRSLRLHLGSAVARHRGRSAAGLLIQTHYHLALEAIERAAEPLRPGRWLAELLPERRAREHPALARPLEGLVDGFAAVVATVRDLLDARFEPALFEGIDEALETDGPTVATSRQVARALALLEVARETFHEIETTGLGSTARLLTRAAELLEARGEALVPARAVLLYGYADATGVVTDLIQALQRRFGAWVLIDRPPDPAAASTDAEPEAAAPLRPGRFGQRFEERLGQAASPEPIPQPTSLRRAEPVPRVEVFTAHGVEGEVREVAQRIAALVDRTRPEGIAVVARDPAPYRREIRRRFELLGLPFSALGEGGSPTPERRRARALMDLLRRGGRTPTERWLEALERLAGSDDETFGRLALLDLRLGLAAVGAGRLGDVADLDVAKLLGDRSFLPLPVHQGLRRRDVGSGSDAPGDSEESSEGEANEMGNAGGDGQADEVRPLRRTLDRKALEAAVTAARRLVAVLDRWPPGASVDEHRQRLHRLMIRELGWRLDGDPEPTGNTTARAPTAAAFPLLDALATLDAEAPAGFELGFDELQRLLARILDARPGSPLGGRGGGVQVLSVTEARGRTFDHLFLLGCNRGVFPRPIREDPLLPDELRQVLQRVLPDMPIKTAGFDEERHLFAQLLSASARVTLSWQHLDDTGAPRPPSPLVERLRLSSEQPEQGESVWAEPPTAEPAWALPTRPGVVRPAVEAATLVALHGPRSAFRAVFPHALRSLAKSMPARPTSEPSPSVAPERLGAARLAVLEEVDPDRSTPEGRAAAARLGPFFGFVGVGSRHRDLWITTVERLAGCPWQVFLTRLLGLEPTPDPLAALPGIDPLLLGRTVHRALEDLVGLPSAAVDTREATDAVTDTWIEDLRRRSPVRPSWPDAEELDRLSTAAAREVLDEEGLALPGLTRALARAAQPYLDGAREQDWSHGPPAVVGVETVGGVKVETPDGGSRFLRFRADRVDREAGDPGGSEEETLVLTDYKTGRPPGRGTNEGKREDTRRRYFLEEVRAGTRLQAVAYALAAADGGTVSIGRYLFLRPDTEFRDRAVGPGDPDFYEGFLPAFHDAVGSSLGVWAVGAFFPRVVDPQGQQEPARCSWCPVAEACVRGDSGARLRIADCALRRGRSSDDPAEAALLALWWLGEKPPSPTADGDREEST
jgi:hypothetical protein